MGALRDGAEKITVSVRYCSGYTIAQMQKEWDWLKGYASYGIQLFLLEAMRMGYIKEKLGKKDPNQFTYHITPKGRNAVDREKLHILHD